MSRKEFHFPIELEHKALWALRRLNMSWNDASKSIVCQFQEIDEVRLRAYKSSTIYNKRKKKWNDPKILKKEFKEVDDVFVEFEV